VAKVVSVPCKFERSILSYAEHEILMRSHHPAIYDVGLNDLRALRQRLRDMRDKERTLAHESAAKRVAKERREVQAFPARPSIP
jgi:hypothetical protein